LALPADIGEPAVPTPAKGGFNLRPGGDLFDPKSIVQHLNIDTQLVHMLQPKLDIVELASCLWSLEVSTRPLGEFPQLLLGQGGKAKAPYFIVDHPILPRFVVGRVEKSWPKPLLRRLQVIPRVFGFDDMGIGIDNREMVLHMVLLPVDQIGAIQS
jgi:hypothetical protein